MPKTYPLEALFRPWFRGPALLRTNLDPNDFAGRTTIASGTATVTVTTRQVNSDSIVSLTPHRDTVQASGFAASLQVRSIVPGVSMDICWSDGQGKAGSTVAMWEVKKTS